MMISQSALLCLESTWQRLLGRSTAIEEPPTGAAAAAGVQGPLMHAIVPLVNAPAVAPVTRAEMVPERAAASDVDAPLSSSERRARAAALRALALSRGRRFDAARSAFVEASRLDPTLDLTRTPSFWSLERAAHEAAIDAYVQTGRDGDAAILRARVRSTFRPRAMRSRSGPVLSSQN